MYIFNLLVAFMFIISLAQGERQTCLDEDAYLNKGLVRRRNVAVNLVEPFYSLHVTELPVEAGDVNRREYKVHVTSYRRLKSIEAVQIITKGHPDCGDGQLTFNKTDFYQFEDATCPRVLKSKSRKMLRESPPLTWSPPFCGCVNFRAIVVYNNTYYKDNTSVENGPLSQIICVEKQHERLSYLKALCAATKSTNAINVIGRPYFLNRYDIDSMTADGVKLIDSLQTRWSQNIICCAKKTKECIVNCMNEVRRRYIDNLCTNNRTDIPLVRYKADHTLSRKCICCNMPDKLKYLCFAANGTFDKITKDTLLDYSKEDTDPANDLAIFGAVEDRDVLRYVTVVKFQDKTTSIDVYDDQFKNTANENTTEAKIETNCDTKDKIRKQCCNEGRKKGHSLATRKAKKAEIECEVGAQTYVSTQKNLKCHVKFCEDNFATCCQKRWCCNKGTKFGSTITTLSNEPTAVSSKCEEDFEVYVKFQDLNNDLMSSLQSCDGRFVRCCVTEASAVHQKLYYGRNQSTLN